MNMLILSLRFGWDRSFGHAAGLLTLALGLGTAWAAAPPLPQNPEDPMCSSISRRLIVDAARAQAALERRSERKSVIPDATAPKLALDWDRQTFLPKLKLQGPQNKVFRLEAAQDLRNLVWKPILEARAPLGSLDFVDSTRSGSEQRFYRLSSMDAFQAEIQVENFTLIDQQGKSRELYYHTHWKAVVLVAAGDSLENLTPILPELRALYDRFSSRNAGFWVLLSKPNPVRAEAASQAASLQIRFPVLLDDELLVSRQLDLNSAGETLVIRPPEFVISYRGPVATPAGPVIEGARTDLLASALEAVLDQTEPNIRVAPMSGPAVPHYPDLQLEYSRDIAPILKEYCVRCHQPGDIGPFALTNHAVIRDRLYAIKHSIRSGIMPPWHADRAYGKWANDLSLPTDAKAKLLQWLDNGAPRGAGPDPLAENHRGSSYSEWPAELGEPDAIVTIPPQEVKAFGTEAYRYIHVQSPNEEDVWLRGAVIVPSNREVVHHYLVWPGRSTFAQITGLAFYVPGVTARVYPSDTGTFLPKKSWLTFNLHYTPNGTDTVDQPRLALWYHRQPPPKELKSLPIVNLFFAVPPGEREHSVQAQVTFTRPVQIHRLYPHMHLRGLRMSYEAVYPNGQRETLLSVPNYHFNWQTGYEMVNPKSLPSGTRLVVQGAFDNSPQNLANPDPTTLVRWGEQSWEEMFIGYLDYTD